ncbi:MAG: hypothetical protein ACREML_07290 [Vulcanimicrobiaceae bacterium]
MFDDCALADPLAESKLTQALGETKVERVGDSGDTDGRARRGRYGTMISAGAFWDNSGNCGASSGHDRFYYVRNVAPVS